MDITALDGETCLSSVDECTPYRSAGGDVHVGVVEDEHGIFAAQLQYHRQQLARRSFADAPAGRDAAREDELVDWRLDQCRPGRAFADNYLHKIGIQARRMH